MKRLGNKETTAMLAACRERLHYNPHTGQISWRVDNTNGVRAGDPIGAPTCFGYRRVGINGVRHFAHRVAWALHYGIWPHGTIDHIDGNGLNNRIENLRVVSQSENLRNQRRSSRNKTGVTGVSIVKKTGAWKACIKGGGQFIYLGTFTDFFEACCTRKSAELKHNFHPNHGRS